MLVGGWEGCPHATYGGGVSRPDPGPIRITTAARSRRDVVAARQRTYLWSMGVRTACFLLAVVFAGHLLMWIFIVGAFLLPPIAVVVANASAPSDPDPDPGTVFDRVPKELDPPKTD